MYQFYYVHEISMKVDCDMSAHNRNALNDSCIKFFKTLGNWPTLLAKHYCFHLKSGVTFLLIATDLETNNNFCQSMLAIFANA